MLKIRHATQTDLPAINRVIEVAVMSWNLPERVKRLSLPSYHYNNVDLQHLEIIVAEQNQQLVAVAAWEQADSKAVPDSCRALLIHGLYVHPDAQHQGIATKLTGLAEQHAIWQEFDGLLVKAQPDAVGFFLKQGMQKMYVQNSSRDYAHRLWKPLRAE